MSPIIALALGALAGYPARMLACRLIEDRVGDVPDSKLMRGHASLALWMSASAFGWAAIALALPTATPAQLAYTLAIFEIVLCISAVDGLIRDGRATVTVYTTPDKWHGVTYREDKPQVVAALRRMAELGQYPTPLWS